MTKNELAPASVAHETGEAAALSAVKKSCTSPSLPSFSNTLSLPD